MKTKSLEKISEQEYTEIVNNAVGLVEKLLEANYPDILDEVYEWCKYHPAAFVKFSQSLFIASYLAGRGDGIFSALLTDNPEEQ